MVLLLSCDKHTESGDGKLSHLFYHLAFSPCICFLSLERPSSTSSLVSVALGSPGPRASQAQTGRRMCHLACGHTWRHSWIYHDSWDLTVMNGYKAKSAKGKAM